MTDTIRDLPVDVAAPAPASGRVDVGRLAMVPLALGLLSLNVAHLATSGANLDLLAAAGAALTAAFYALVVWAYGRRSRAQATSRSWASHTSAIVASWLPFGFPFLPHGHPVPAVSAVADALILAGLSWCLWGLRTLGRSFSVLAQARAVITAGPYRWVRHPLYLGEIIACAGLALNSPGLPSLLVWLLLIALQLHRSLHEERVLGANLPDYAAYRVRTRRLIPGVL